MLFWHLLQPTAYWWTVYSFSNELRGQELNMALVVGCREGLYLISTLASCIVCPKVFLVNGAGASLDVSTDARGMGPGLKLLLQRVGLVLCPEKMIVARLLRSVYHDMYHFLQFPIMFVDFLSLVAFVTYINGGVPVPLMISYGVTSASVAFVILL